MSKLEDAKKILSDLQVPASQQSDLCCNALLALSDLKESDEWSSASNRWVRIHDINPNIKVKAENLFFDDNTDLSIRPDFVIDAIDSVQSKIALYKWCYKNNVPFISSMGAARKTDISKIKIAKISKTTVCPLASKIRHIVREEKLKDFPVVYSTETALPQKNGGREFGSAVTVTGTFGLMLADFAIKKLIS